METLKIYTFLLIDYNFSFNFQLNITTCMWLTPDRIMFGTDTGLIMMCENGELRHNCVFKAAEVMEMSLKKVETE